jgi:hypothetical protein
MKKLFAFLILAALLAAPLEAGRRAGQLQRGPCGRPIYNRAAARAYANYPLPGGYCTCQPRPNPGSGPPPYPTSR